MAGADEPAELRGEIVALETALAAAFGEIAALRASVTGGGAKAAGETMDATATDLEGSVLHGIVLAEAAGEAGAAAGFERRMERTPTPCAMRSASRTGRSDGVPQEGVCAAVLPAPLLPPRIRSHLPRSHTVRPAGGWREDG